MSLDPSYIDPAAIPKCYDRLEKAKEALYHCRNANNFRQFASRWASFLMYSGSILNILNAGSKKTPQGSQWYGGIKRSCRQDPLVAYMHQARNIEEHEIDPTTRNEGPSVAIGGPNESVYIDHFTEDQRFWANPREAIQGKMWNEHGQTPTVIHHKGGPKLLPVTDTRFNTVFQPPTEHKGKTLGNNDPISVAELYYAFLSELVSKASELA